MLDPISAIAMATSAFNAVKSLVNAGRELEDVAGQLGKWYTAAADLNKASEYAKNPPIFKKLLFSGSVEEEALQILVHKKKLYEQEKELRTLIMFRFGQEAYVEMIQMRRKIQKDRERAIYARKEKIRKIRDGILITILIVACVAVISSMVWLIVTKGNV